MNLRETLKLMYVNEASGERNIKLKEYWNTGNGRIVYDGKMTVEKINKPKYLNLTERLEAFYKRPIEEIYVESTQEVDVGDPKGNEIW